MNPTGVQQCWIVGYPLECIFGVGTPCIRGTHYKQAVLWMILVLSCASVAVILICLTLVAHSVWRQRNIVREQHNKLPEAAHQRANTSSVCFSSDAALKTTAIPQEPQSVTEDAIAESHQHIPKDKSISPAERLANEAIGQCLFSGFSFVNLVIWTNVGLSYGIAGDLETMNRMWVRFPSASTNIRSFACTALTNIHAPATVHPIVLFS
jgi:heme exporter protein D